MFKLGLKKKRGTIHPAENKQHVGVVVNDERAVRKKQQAIVEQRAAAEMAAQPAKPSAVTSRLTRLQIKRKDKDYLLENLAMELTAGLGVLQAIEAITEDLSSRYLKKITRQIASDIDEGLTLADALERTGIMPAHVISLIRIGEESGRLPENLQVVILQQQKDREFRSRIFSAMMYPVFVLVLTLFIGIGVAWFILPRLSTVFAQLDVELPWITRFMIGLGEFFANYGSLAVPLFLVALAGGLYLLFINQRTRFIGQWLLFRVPGVKQLMMEIELGRMGYILGTLLEAGLPIVEAIESLAKAGTLTMYRKLYRHLAASVNDGSSIHESFNSYKRLKSFFPATIQQMIAAGEQSGHLPQTLTKIGKNFETKTETTTKNLSVILEPILLVIVWLGVIFVALAVVLPVYSLIGGLEVV